MLSANLSGILVLLALIGIFILAIYMKAKKGDRALSKIRTNRKVLYEKILESRLKVAKNLPDCKQAQVLLIEAGMMLVYPKADYDSLQPPRLDSVLLRLEAGFDALDRVEMLLNGAKMVGPVGSESRMYGRQSELHDRILTVSKEIASTCPENVEAHELLIEASKKLVLPSDHFVTDHGHNAFDDAIVHYDRGLVYVARAATIAEICKQQSEV